MNDATYQTGILNFLANGPATYGDINRAVVKINVSAAHADCREDFGILLAAGRVRRVGVSPDGAAYLFAS
jgi:hypothetical protein